MMAEASGSDAALVVAIVAAVFAGLAAVFAGWSAWSSHRSAVLAEEAVKLERDRHHRELSPRIELEHDDQSDGVWIINAGPIDYSTIVIGLPQADTNWPIEGFLLDGDGEVVTGFFFGPLAVGERRLVKYRRRISRNEKGMLYLRLHCQSDRGDWRIPAQVEIPGPRWPGVEIG